jgi:hypothetical protein
MDEFVLATDRTSHYGGQTRHAGATEASRGFFQTKSSCFLKEAVWHAGLGKQLETDAQALNAK